jgi:N-acetylglucosamine kinase-like BadF-type ATPase
MGVSPVVVAVDGGGTKTDVVALNPDGAIVGRVRGRGSNPQVIGLSTSVALIDRLVREACGGASVAAAGLYLSGLDLPRELDAMGAAVKDLDWAANAVIDNDLFALLRTGTAEPDAVAVICGTGINAVGVRADGARVRFPALGQISGDWGGGSGIGNEALWHVARANDGRGPQTALTPAVLESLQVASVNALIEQLHFGERSYEQLNALAPVVFALGDSDEIAAGLVDRQAAEIVTLAVTCLRRLDLLDRPVPVVLGGGILAAAYPRLMAGITAGLAAEAGSARVVAVPSPPVVGAALLTLARVQADDTALATAQRSLSVKV